MGVYISRTCFPDVYGCLGSREQEYERESEKKKHWQGEKGHFSFREQGAKTPQLVGPHL